MIAETSESDAGSGEAIFWEVIMRQGFEKFDRAFLIKVFLLDGCDFGVIIVLDIITSV